MDGRSTIHPITRKSTIQPSLQQTFDFVNIFVKAIKAIIIFIGTPISLITYAIQINSVHTKNLRERMNSGFEEIVTMNKIFESKLGLVNKEISVVNKEISVMNKIFEDRSNLENWSYPTL
ncbi:hypothetical protein GLOIN_2v1509675 [Rhizophagus clarus]|uniref:Uncharacterized protein n=1 Tax=Rhizophagus clarus TaxID=94130 RepID=A0A8H3KSY2_9GLOM|nr:hypothetical protein GLOIN_2v1509675 [Rhizophagus clarus]